MFRIAAGGQPFGPLHQAGIGYSCGPWCREGTNPPTPGTLGNVWRHFWLLEVEGRPLESVVITSIFDSPVILRSISYFIMYALHTCSVTQLCLTLCNPTDCSSPGSSVHEIFQARILVQVAISSFRGSYQCRAWTKSPTSAGKFFTTEPPRKPILFCVFNPIPY